MQVQQDDHAGERRFTITGQVTTADVPELQARLAAALDGGAHDLLLDGRPLTRFDDDALVALTSARSRAKSQHHRIVAIDDDGGALSASLRRSGLIFRFPVYPDAPAATAGLLADRTALAARGVAVAPRAVATA